MRGFQNRLLAFSLLAIAFLSMAADPPGKPEPDGPRPAPGNRRGRRHLRWELFFGNLEAKEYLDQAAGLGMFLVVIDNKGDLYLLKDLKERPARPVKIDDGQIKEMKRNWFMDDHGESCKSISAELRLRFVPFAMMFFYPVEFEGLLLKKELDFKGRKEEQIKRTKFKVSVKDGKPVVEVTEQEVFDTPKKP